MTHGQLVMFGLLLTQLFGCALVCATQRPAAVMAGATIAVGGVMAMLVVGLHC